MSGILKVSGKIMSLMGRGIVIVPQFILQLLGWIITLVRIAIDFIASASIYGSVVIVLIFTAGGIYNVVQLHDSVVGTIILFSLVAGILLFIYNLAASIFNTILISISIALSLIELGFGAINSGSEIVYKWFGRMAGQEAYEDYVNKKNDKAFIREGRESAIQ